MIPLYYDLHLHSCLSPCGDDDMTPANIVGMAAVKGLDVIALTDHNSCKNCPAAMKHGEEYGVTVIPGMELTTSEEVHVVCLFPELNDALDFDQYVYERILPIKNKKNIFGEQQIMNELDQVIEVEERLLISATSISFDEVFDLVKSYHGIAYPAHIDKSTTSLLSNLGFVPPDSSFTCAEITTYDHLHQIQKEHPYFLRCNIISSSDAHYLQDIHEPNYQLYARSRQIPDILDSLSRQPHT
ncbi:PHP domain-containing protein [Faecalicatena contorta]|uniref:PHP domain-containing protein n=1 Tax=Faecalicatena contorta TaxID=39482 RepID=UPI001F47FE73|nr:PHP domain-containing protein [Faecalicatena contorta]MCF2682617.1 PHP domain-containing protein [Faecalicatena contorta]